MSALEAMLDSLRDVIRAYGSVIVAYSGGVDSAVVLRVAHDVLADRAIGCIGKSPAYPDSELSGAVSLAQQHNLSVRIIETDEHLNPNYAANDGNRCFHCRDHLFRALQSLAKSLGFANVADGVHCDDVADHAGGINAARKHGVRSPLLESHVTKADVRTIARYLGMNVWDKPAMACLASRIPNGTPVTLGLLTRIGQAEAAIASLGFCNFRVRHHGDLARLELEESQFALALAHRAEIAHRLELCGYHQVALDLSPRRTN